MTAKRSTSSPPARGRGAAQAAARAAEAAAAAAAHAAEAAAAAATEEENESDTALLTSIPFPPDANRAGLRLWFLRGYEGHPTGIYTTEALRSRGVDVEAAHPADRLMGWKTEAPPLRRASQQGTDTTTIYWR